MPHSTLRTLIEHRYAEALAAAARIGAAEAANAYPEESDIFDYLGGLYDIANDRNLTREERQEAAALVLAYRAAHLWPDLALLDVIYARD